MSSNELPSIGIPKPDRTEYPITEVSVLINNPSPRQIILDGLTRAPSVVVLTVALGFLSWVIKHARRTDPFTKRIVNGLRWNGIVFATGIVAVAVETWAQWALSESVLVNRWGATMDVPFAWLFGAFLCFAVAEVVQRGVLMREELAAVI